MKYQVPDALPEELVEFLVDEWQSQQKQIDTLVKIIKHHRRRLDDVHGELAWIDMALRDHFPHWFEPGPYDEEDEDE